MRSTRGEATLWGQRTALLLGAKPRYSSSDYDSGIWLKGMLQEKRAGVAPARLLNVGL